LPDVNTYPDLGMGGNCVLSAGGADPTSPAREAAHLGSPEA